MQILGRYCVLVSVYSVLELYVLRILVGFWVMDVTSMLKFLTKAGEIGFGFVIRGSFSRFLNGLAMLLIFVLCMKFLHFGCHFKGLMRFLCEFGSKPRNGFFFKNGVIEVCASMITHFKCGPLESSQNLDVLNKSNSISGKENAKSNDDADTNFNISEEKDDNNQSEVHDEDEEIDVTTLRKLVKIERQRADSACEELERERRASESAAEEAMAMILRLQSEKSSVEMEANQFRRMAEQKQQYAHEVIESLQWINLQNESQFSLLEDQLMLYREKLRLYMNEDEMEQFEEGLDDDDKTFSSFSVDKDLDDSLIS